MIMHQFLFMGVRDVLSIDEIVEATNITYLGLIRDAATQLARQARQEANILAEIYRSHTKAAEVAKTTDTTEEGGHT